MRRKRPPLSIRSLALAAECRWSRGRRTGNRRADPKLAAACVARHEQAKQRVPEDRIKAKRIADAHRKARITRDAMIRKLTAESELVRPTFE